VDFTSIFFTRIYDVVLRQDILPVTGHETRKFNLLAPEFFI